MKHYQGVSFLRVTSAMWGVEGVRSGVRCHESISRALLFCPVQSPGTVLRKIHNCISISAKFKTACRSEVIVSNTLIFMSIQFTNWSIKSFIHDLSLTWSSGSVWSLWNAMSVPAITTITWSYSPQSNSNAKLPDRLIIKWNLHSFVSGDQAVSTFKRWIAERRLRLDNCNDVHVEFQWINNLVHKLLSCVQWPIHHLCDLIWSYHLLSLGLVTHQSVNLASNPVWESLCK